MFFWEEETKRPKFGQDNLCQRFINDSPLISLVILETEIS